MAVNVGREVIINSMIAHIKKYENRYRVILYGDSCVEFYIPLNCDSAKIFEKYFVVRSKSIDIKELKWYHTIFNNKSIRRIKWKFAKKFLIW